ncbi:MAG: response regulator transcription factor [Oscillospiraceae bacterium]|nr:response regulator transcription factor [Oscillospiraceae bacterium]
MPEHILIADDDKDIADIIAETLSDEGYIAHTAKNGLEVLEIMKSKEISLFILDIMMPELDGLETLRCIKKESDAPVMILSAKGRDIDKVIGLKIGADDYMSKPFSMDELVARVNAHMRREHKKNMDILKLGGIELRKSAFQAFANGVPVDLSAKEFQILCFLVENKGRVLTREQIYSAIWNDAYGGDVNTVTVHIKNIRAKLGESGSILKTIWGIGYKMENGV